MCVRVRVHVYDYADISMYLHANNVPACIACMTKLYVLNNIIYTNI